MSLFHVYSELFIILLSKTLREGSTIGKQCEIEPYKLCNFNKLRFVLRGGLFVRAPGVSADCDTGKKTFVIVFRGSETHALAGYSVVLRLSVYL
jgi:hypothetical protein